MSTKDGFTKTLRFSVETDEKLEKLARKFGSSKFQFFKSMVEYFYRTKKDPCDLNDDVLKNTLSKNHDTYTSFIKTQEKIILMPIQNNVERMIRNQEQIVKSFNEQVLVSNKQMSDKYKIQLESLSESLLLIKAIHDNLESKKRLKTKFSNLFTAYVRNREALGAFKIREKDDLFNQTLKALEDL